MKTLLIMLSLSILQSSLATETDHIKSLKEISTNMIKSQGTDFSAVDREKVINSLYEQIRPNIKITKKNIPKDEIEKKTKEFITMAYYPALVQSYIRVYEKMTKAKASIQDCKKASYFKFSEDIKATLCLKRFNTQEIEVYYLTSFNKSSPKLNASFTFNKKELIGINMHKKDGVEFTIKGL